MNNKTKIGIIDDEILIVEAIEILLSTVPNLSTVFVSTNPTEAIEKLAIMDQEMLPEILFIDIKMEPINGFEVVEKLRIIQPQIKLIILTSYYTQLYLDQMVKKGISAFIPKNTNREKLIYIIDTVRRDGVYFSPEDQKVILNYLQNNNSYFKEIIKFTKREIEIIQLICKEYTNQEIADKLFLSKRTVESHRVRILERIGAKNTIGLVVHALINQIIPFDFNQN